MRPITTKVIRIEKKELQMKILITGANGFIGGAIVEEFINKKFDSTEIFCVGGLSSEVLDLPNYFAVDITKEENLSEILKISKVDTFIHTAGLAHQFSEPPPEKFWEVNVKGTENAVKLAAGLKAGHFILISSVSVYGKKRENGIETKRFTETDFCAPESVYARSKLEAEKIAEKICLENKMALTILRLATVIGEGDRGNVLRLIKIIDKGRFFWIGKGENLKSLIYKGDAARACRVLALEKKTAETEIFNVSANPVSMREIVEKIAENLERKIPRAFIPTALLLKTLRFFSKIRSWKRIKKVSETVGKWLSEEVFSAEKIKTEYGFEPQTSVDEALEREVIWYRSL